MSLKLDINYTIGDTVKFISRTSYGSINPGDILTVLDIQDGIFPPDLYTIVKDMNGKKHAAYIWRFTKHVT